MAATRTIIGNERGTAVVGLAVIIPAVLLLIFVAYRLGIETSFRASIEYQQQILLNSQIQSSFMVRPGDIFGL